MRKAIDRRQKVKFLTVTEEGHPGKRVCFPESEGKEYFRKRGGGSAMSGTSETASQVRLEKNSGI